MDERATRRGSKRRGLGAAERLQKMVTQTLRELERDGVLTRTTIPSVPVRVEYELTQLGQNLLDLVRTIRDWSEVHE